MSKRYDWWRNVTGTEAFERASVSCTTRLLTGELARELQLLKSVEALFAKIEAGEPEALKELASALAAHMTIEHEFFYPESREVDEDAVLEASRSTRSPKRH